MTHFSRLPRLVAGLTLALAGSNLAASGFQLREQSPSAQGNAFAGITAGGSDISAMFFNPATLGQFDGMAFVFGASSVAPTAKFGDIRASRATGSTISGPTSSKDAAEDVVLPALYALWSPSKDWRVGFSVNVPFGMATDYPADFAGRYHARRSDLKVVDIAASAAYRLSDYVTLGLSVLSRQANAELTNAMDFGLMASAKYGGAFDGVAKLEGSASALGWKAGLVVTPVPGLRLGLAHASAMDMKLKGDATFAYAETTPAPIVTGLKSKGLVDGSATAALNLPATTSLGITYEVSPTVGVQAEVARTEWSRFKELRVTFTTGLPDSVTDESWRDTFFTSVGVTWKLTSTVTLRAGLAQDQGAAPNFARTPRVPDADRTWYSVGAGWQVSKAFGLDLAYTQITVDDGPVGLEAGKSSASSNFLRGNLSGVFRSSIQIVALGARLRF